MQDSSQIAVPPVPPGEPAQDSFDTQYRIQALERAAAILGAFTAEEPELRLSDLAERLGLHKATTHRFLVNLEHLGFVERSPRSGRYRLGWRLFEPYITRGLGLEEIAQPAIQAEILSVLQRLTAPEPAGAKRRAPRGV